MAGGIHKRKSGFSDPYVIRDSFESDTEFFYCTECKDELNKLYPRADYNESDADQWLQCRICGDIKNINEFKHSSKLESFAVPSDNPYEGKNIIMGLDNKVKRTGRQRDPDNHRKYLDSIEDKNEREDRKKLIRYI